nr:PTS sugar transporter subunit IIA [Aeromonas veronii]
MITTLINEHLINLDLKATRKEEVFTEMARLLASQGKVSDEQAFIKVMSQLRVAWGAPAPHANMF